METENKRERKQRVKEQMQEGLHMFLNDIDKKEEEEEVLTKKKVEYKLKHGFTVNNYIS